MDNRSRARQTWTIAKIELRRAFFSRRAFGVYVLALLPALIFIASNIDTRMRRASLSAHGLANPALIDGIREGEPDEDVLRRLGKPASDVQWQETRHVRGPSEQNGITVHKISPPVDARFVRLNIILPTYRNDRTARIYEFEVYGSGPDNLALGRPATGSEPCEASRGPEKAFNGSVSGGRDDSWCSRGRQPFLQVDLGRVVPVHRVVVKHAGAGGEEEELNTRLFHILAGTDNRNFVTVVYATGARLVEEIRSRRRLTYFDGSRVARLDFTDGKLTSRELRPLLDFEEDRKIFAGVFQFFYLRLAIFFGCLGIFMNLFRGEILDKTLHYWFLVPARREVLLAGKYGAGLVASITIFSSGALLSFFMLLWTHNPVEVQAYWQAHGMAHALWYVVAAALGCVGYGSVFLAAGLILRNPIIPAAVLLGWESINAFLPEVLQKLSVLYYLQSLCPVPAPLDPEMSPVLRLLLAPAPPAPKPWAILGLIAVTAAVLWLARRAILRMQLSYGTE